MTDTEALKILSAKHIDDMDIYCEAIYIAAKRLEECQWRDYEPERFGSDWRMAFGSKVILGIRYSDGSKGSVSGFVNYDTQKGFYLCMDAEHKSYLTENAVIEKYMKYPDYD